MSNNHYHKCLHIGHLQKTRMKGKPYICLKVAGTIQLVLICPDCHGLLKMGKIVDVRFYGGKNKDRKIKRYRGDTAPVFFELMVV